MTLAEKIKQRFLEKIEKNAFCSDLTYTKRNGEQITEKVYFKRSGLPLIGDWGRIYPPVKEVDGKLKIVWVNFLIGGFKNFMKLLFIGFIIAMVVFQFDANFRTIEILRQTCDSAINMSSIITP